MEIDKAKAALVCNLTVEEMGERKKYLQEEIFNLQKISKIEPIQTGYRYIFNQPVDFSRKLVEFINVERKCCPSFAFTLEFEPEEGPMALTIFGSDQIRDLLSAMIENSELKVLL